eukprot:1232226-Amphidinium_carterae.1
MLALVDNPRLTELKQDLCSMDHWPKQGRPVIFEQDSKVPKGAIEELMSVKECGENPVLLGNLVPRTRLMGAYAMQGCGISKGVTAFSEIGRAS